MKRTVRLDIAYDGTGLAGWQVQPGRPTVQGALQESLRRILIEEIRVDGAGRTDAGVHARGQVASFETDRSLPAERIAQALNALLPGAIRVLRASEAGKGFQARRSALSKEYRYFIHRGEVVPPWRLAYVHAVKGALDLDGMRKAARLFVGRRDFSRFRAVGSSARTSVREVTVSEWFEEGAELVYRIEACGFLYRMVRAIAGTLVAVGQGRLQPQDVSGLLEGETAARAGPFLPARGLHLWRVRYPGEPGEG